MPSSKIKSRQHFFFLHHITYFESLLSHTKRYAYKRCTLKNKNKIEGNITVCGPTCVIYRVLLLLSFFFFKSKVIFLFYVSHVFLAFGKVVIIIIIIDFVNGSIVILLFVVFTSNIFLFIF